VLTAEYREATQSGYYEVEGSITRGDRESEVDRPVERTRGHIDGFGDFEINPYWTTGFAIARASDPTYLARYGFARGLPSLTQNVYLEGHRGRENARIDAYYFQSLDADVEEDTVPWVLPLFDYGWRSEPGIVGGVWAFDANARVLGRPDGADSRRLSLTLGWNLPHVSPLGEVYRLRLSLRGDAYHVSGVVDPQSPAGATLEGFTGRVVPRIELGWRWPWVLESGGARLVVEPVVQLIASPNGGNPKEIPNEDSLSFEFDDANLLSANRFPGLDRVEGGVRANYAARFAVYGAGAGWSEFLFGQSWRLQDDDTFESGTGLSQHFSDYVGRLTVAPDPLLNLGLRFRLDRGNLTPRRVELSVGGGPQWLRGQLSYINLSDEPTAGVPSTVEQLNVNGVYRFAENWSLSAHHQRDLGEPGGSLLTGIGLTYANECVTVSVQANRNFTRELDVEESTNVSVTVRLRNLG
jgi:LPS-assembly protein